MANLLSKISMFLIFGAGLFFFILAQIFFRHEKWKSFFEGVASLCFGMGLVLFMLFPLFIQAGLWVLAGLALFVGILFLIHSKG